MILCDIMDCSMPGSSVLHCLLENESESQSVVSDSLWHHGLYSPWNSLGQNTGVGSLSLLHRIFPTQGSNPGILHCRQTLHCLSHQGSPYQLGIDKREYEISECVWERQQERERMRGEMHREWGRKWTDEMKESGIQNFPNRGSNLRLL